MLHFHVRRDLAQVKCCGFTIYHQVSLRQQIKVLMRMRNISHCIIVSVQSKSAHFGHLMSDFC